MEVMRARGLVLGQVGFYKYATELSSTWRRNITVTVNALEKK